MYHIFFKLLKISGLLFCLTLSLTVVGQTKRIDSLKQVLSKQEGIENFAVAYDLSWEYIDMDNSKALEYADLAMDIALEFGDSAKIVRAGLARGHSLFKMTRIDHAINQFEKSLRIARRHDFKTDVKFILNSTAICYTYQGDYDQALDYHFQSLIMREKEGNKAAISNSFMNIGLVYYKLRNFEKAIEYNMRSYALKKEVNDTYNLEQLLTNTGLCYYQVKDFRKAKQSFNESLSICGKNCSDNLIMQAEEGLGLAYHGSGALDEAVAHFEASYQIAKKIDDTRFQASALIHMAELSIAEKRYKDAVEKLSESELVAAQGGHKELLIDTYRKFSLVYNDSGDYKNAAFYQRKYINLKDSVYSDRLIKNLAKIETNFEERENLATIKLKEEALVRQRNLNLAIGVIAVLAGLLGFVLYRSNVVTRKVNSALSDAKAIIEKQNNKLFEINRDLDAKVKEKTTDLLKANDELDKANISLSQVNGELDNFIYKTSHDIRGPLASLKGICSVALMDVKDPLALDYFQKLDVSSGRLNVILTRLLIVNQINNAVVGKALVDFDSIIDDVMLLEKKKGLPPRFEIQKEIEKNVALYSDKDLVRIILENLIDNAIKFHNDSDRVNPFVHIKIGTTNSRVVVSVIDNGIGIAEVKPDKIFQMFSRASERSGTGGIGLYLSKLATEKLGGEIHLRNTREGYTEFYVSFPQMA